MFFFLYNATTLIYNNDKYHSYYWKKDNILLRLSEPRDREFIYLNDLDSEAMTVLEGEKWVKNQKLTITRFSIMLCDLISAYAYKANLQLLQKIDCLKAAMEIEKRTSPISGIDESEVSIDFAFQSISISDLYCEAGDRENALNFLEDATKYSLYHIEFMDKTNEDGSNYFPWPTSRNLCWILWEDYLVKPQFDIIRNNERFIKCLEMLKANSNVLKAMN